MVGIPPELALATVNLPTKFEVSISTHYKNMKGGTLATAEGCKAELIYVTWKRTGWEINSRPVNRKSNAPPQRHHATKLCLSRRILIVTHQETARDAASVHFCPSITKMDILVYYCINKSPCRFQVTFGRKLKLCVWHFLGPFKNSSRLTVISEKHLATNNSLSSRRHGPTMDRQAQWIPHGYLQLLWYAYQCLFLVFT